LDRIDLRPAIPSDSFQIASLHTESWRGSYRGILPDAYLDEEIPGERLKHWETWFLTPGIDRRCVLLAEAGRELAGFVSVLLDEEPEWGACLDNLHVRPDHRNRGLGRKLFAQATRWVMAREPGWAIHLWVFEANYPARRFYEAFKGEVVDREMREMPGGAKVSSLRYVWRFPGMLWNDLMACSPKGE